MKLQEMGGPETAAEQVTAVVPTANNDPLGGVHVEVTEGEPAVAGAVNVTATGLLSGDTVWMGAGHVNVGGGPDGAVAQAAAAISHESAVRPDKTLARIDRALLDADTDLTSQAAGVRRCTVVFRRAEEG